MALPAAANPAAPALPGAAPNHGAVAFPGEDLFTELLAQLTEVGAFSPESTSASEASASPFPQSMAGMPFPPARFLHTSALFHGKPPSPTCEDTEVVGQPPHAVRAYPTATVQIEYSAAVTVPPYSVLEAGPEFESDTESGDRFHLGDQTVAAAPLLMVDTPAEPKALVFVGADFVWLPESQPDGPSVEDNSCVHPPEEHLRDEKSPVWNGTPSASSTPHIQDSAPQEVVNEQQPVERREPPLPVPSFVSLSPELPRPVIVPNQPPPAEIESRRFSAIPVTRLDPEPLRGVQASKSGSPHAESAEPVAREAFRLLLRPTIPYHPGPDAVAHPPAEAGIIHQPKLDGVVAELTERGKPAIAAVDAQVAETTNLTPTFSRSGREPAQARTWSRPASEVPVKPQISSQTASAHFDGHPTPQEEGAPPLRVEEKSSTYFSEEEPGQSNAGKDDRVSSPVQSRESGHVWTSSRVPTQPDLQPESNDSVAEATPVEPIEEPAPAVPASRTVRQLRLSVETTPAGSPVELRLHQRPDGVEVSVHSQDSQVRDSLRTGLSDLVNNLEKQGVSSEMLHPLRSNLPENSSEPSAHRARTDEFASPVAEASESEARDDTHRRQREPLWESGGDQRRRRDQQPDAWQKYLEEYTWRNR